MSTCPPAAARYRAAAKIASEAFHGSATPSPLASMPQRSQVDGMNCIQPTAPAELGPMLRPKSASTLLIAARTDHGMLYAAPARCHSACSSADVSSCGCPGGVTRSGGTTSVAGSFGSALDGSAGGALSARAV